MTTSSVLPLAFSGAQTALPPLSDAEQAIGFGSESEFTGSGEKLRLLIVDDDTVDRLAILRALREWPGQLLVEEAATGNEALEKFADKQFDAVLLDYRLPDLDGLELLRIMNARRKGSTAILVLTGLDDDEVALSCIEAGAQDYLLKKELSSRHLRRAVIHARMRHNIEMELLKSHARVRDLSERDSLTGLYNRAVFEKNLRESILRARRHDFHLALLMLDLDNFKMINDSYGHDVGDEILRVLAERLAEQVRAGDILCRIGGDEFAVLSFCGEDSQYLHTFAKRMIETAAQSIEVDGQIILPTVSIGIALAPENADNADAFLRCADLAIYKAKKNGRNSIHYYAAELQQQVMRHVKVERGIRSALQSGEFEPHYQPQVCSSTGKIVGAEALIRWRHPEDGLLAPASFLDVAEDTGLIVPMGTKMLEKSCEDFMSGCLKNSDVRLSVNLSARQLQSEGLFAHICRVLDESGLPARRLEVEITESMLIENLDASRSLLCSIANMGVSIALDDFGTGYSSLSYLKQLPISTLKVDRSFLSNVPDGEKDSRILQALVSMAHQMEYEVIVEGVETEAQAQKCRDIGVEYQQGFFFERPVSLNTFVEMLS